MKGVFSTFLLYSFYALNLCLFVTVQSYVEMVPHYVSKVHEISVENIGEVKNDHQPWLIVFYADWCMHCKAFLPKFDIFAGEIGRLGDLSDVQAINPRLDPFVNLEDVNFGKINCTSDKKMSQIFHVTSYPSIRLLYGENVFVFSGQRSSTNIANFITSIKAGEHEFESFPLNIKLLSSVAWNDMTYIEKFAATLHKMRSSNMYEILGAVAFGVISFLLAYSCLYCCFMQSDEEFKKNLREKLEAMEEAKNIRETKKNK